MLRIREVVSQEPRAVFEPRALLAVDVNEQDFARPVEPLQRKFEIIRDFEDPYLELIRLVREACEVEHALMVQYLFGAFSVKDEYATIRGFSMPSAFNLLGVAVQEMLHLREVNGLLVALGSKPCLVRQDFPYEPDIYPFPFELEPLSPSSLAKYVYTEAPAEAISPGGEDAEFLTKLYQILGSDTRPNHLGSLYGTIIDVAREVSNSNDTQLDLDPWIARLELIKGQGEVDHFHFFRDLFMGRMPAFHGQEVWKLDPADPHYPSHPLPRNPSAFEGHPSEIRSDWRRAGWLADLQYWIILSLLDLSYRRGDAKALELARQHMTAQLWELGLHLGRQGVGVPFDVLSMGYSVGLDERETAKTLARLIETSQSVTKQTAELLPPTYPRSADQVTLDFVKALAAQ